MDFTKTAQNFEKRKGEIDEKDKIPPPPWLDMYRDQLAFFYFREEKILKEGTVLPGALVAGNEKLYKKSLLFYKNKSHPAHFIYSWDPFFFTRPESLSEIAQNVEQVYRSGKTKAEETGAMRMFGGGFDRPIQQRLPASFAKDKAVYLTTVIVNRRHLPQGKLSGENRLYPLIVIDDDKADAMMLPKWYWILK